MTHERLAAVGVLLLALLVGTTFSEDTWVDKIERRVKQNLGDSIQWISGPDHKNDFAKPKHSSFVRKMGIGIAVAFGCLAGAIACFCAYICARKRRNVQRTPPLVGTSSLAPAVSGSCIQDGSGYQQGLQPNSQPWPQAPCGPGQPQQLYPPSYSQPYPQQHSYLPEHHGASAPPYVPTAPPVSFEQMPMPPPPYDYKETGRY